MPYEPNFYVPRNIVGWTGNIWALPTVYFWRRVQGNVVEFGHITQDHGDGENVGRELVRQSSDYRVANEFYEGAYRFVERWDGDVSIHPSRHIFNSVRSLPESRRVILEHSIQAFPEAKPSQADYTDEAFDALLATLPDPTNT